MVGLAPGWGYPTLNGPTGLVHTPTAETTEAMVGVEVDVPYINSEGGGAYNVNALVSLGARVEANASLLTVNPEQASAENGFGLSAKLVLRPQSLLLPGLAIGAAYRDVTDVGRRTILYLAASKQLTPRVAGSALYGHVNLSWQRFDPEVGGSVEDFVPAVGLELRMDNGLSLVADYTFENDVDGKDILAGALRYRFKPLPLLWMQVGFADDGVFFTGLRATLALGR